MIVKQFKGLFLTLVYIHIQNMNTCNYTQDIGTLDIIIGCMFSGKTTELLNRIRKALIICNNIVVVNHNLDNRYDKTGGYICSHDQQKIKALSCSNLKELLHNPDYKNSPIIFIDEAQFFSDLKSFVVHAVDVDNKWVTVCGLDGDFQRNKFGDILDLIPFADTVVKTSALCLKCCNGTKGLFSAKLKNQNQNQIDVGNEDKYIPVCRKHFIELHD